MNAIIVGANGQDGFYLMELLLKKGINVLGISRSGSFTRLNLTNFNDVKNLIQHNKPDYLFHLAANSTTRHEVLIENHETISTGTLNILESIRLYSPHTKTFIS